ncbi:sulfite exporter TauE/SafE family protein [Ostreiculturibacter nitratireducens]|uniref:sulfite exporter TauE/SafE family protein n=1 Tax=Ostreiculturibacter nitratireducens TaxID=3075226 RepID=UPI0031B5F69B
MSDLAMESRGFHIIDDRAEISGTYGIVGEHMEFDYSGWQVAAILATYLLAATAKGVTGLGFSTTCLPFLAVTVGLKEALPLLIIPSISSNLAVMHGAGRFGETLRRFWPMLVATVPGLIVGLWALALIDGRQAGGVLGVVLVSWCTFAYARPEVRLPARWERPLGPVSGFLTGAVNGLTGSQVMPSMPYLMALHLERNVFVQAINCSFTLSSVIMAVGLERLGLFTRDGVILSTIGTAFAFTGLKFGERIRHYLSPDAFRLSVLLMLSAMGVSLVVRAF